MSKAPRLPQKSRLFIFYCISNHENFIPNSSITLLQIPLKLQKHRGGYWRKKLPWMISEEQFPVPRCTAVSKIGNSVISLLWQLRCRCNPDHNKFSSLSNTAVVAIFSRLCLWRRSLCSNLGGIGPGKLYRASLSEISLFLCRGDLGSRFPKTFRNFLQFLFGPISYWLNGLLNLKQVQAETDRLLVGDGLFHMTRAELLKAWLPLTVG